MKQFLLALAIASVCGINASAQDIAQRPPEISAGGRGDISVKPDRAVVTVTVENNATYAATAASENARLVAMTLDKLRAAGAKDAALTNGGYSLNQDYENGDRRRPRGFIARNSIRIEVPQVNDVGKLIDAAISGGATTVSPIQYLAPDMPAARDNALKAAVAAATRDARTLAEASGGSLGRLLSMTTGYSQPQYQMNEVVVTGLAQSMSGTSLRPSDISLGAVAMGRWEFLPKR